MNNLSSKLLYLLIETLISIKGSKKDLLLEHIYQDQKNLLIMFMGHMQLKIKLLNYIKITLNTLILEIFSKNLKTEKKI